jgi:hypothetical protein
VSYQLTVRELRLDVRRAGAAVTVGALASTNVFRMENGPKPLPDCARTLYWTSADALKPEWVYSRVSMSVIVSTNVQALSGSLASLWCTS